MQPPSQLGLRHVAFFVANFEACEFFYTQILNMNIVWRPDNDNLYLSTGSDNLALHRAPENFVAAAGQRLDHIGFFLETAEAVDAWHDYLVAKQVVIKAAPKNHRDGTRSFYCADPDDNVIQMIYYPLS